MSITNYNNAILKSLELYDFNSNFLPQCYPNSNSIFHYFKNELGITSRYVNLKSFNKPTHCPHCGGVSNIKSKGLRKIFLHHATIAHIKNYS